MFFKKLEDQYIPLIQNGLPARHALPKRVIVVGAGIAGLVAAYELVRAGHDVQVLEAQGRPGGRIYTLREPFAPGLYGEAGAMRIPKSHRLTLAYIEKFGLKTYPFVIDNPAAYSYIGGKRHRLSEIRQKPELLGFDVYSSEQGRQVGQMWTEALEPILQRLRVGTDHRSEGEQAWEEICAEHDMYSVREFLEVKGWSEGAIEAFGLLHNQESMMNSSFLELLREEVGEFYTNLLQIEGGSDRLPLAFFPGLKERIHFGARVIALDQTPKMATVYYQTAAGRFNLNADRVILTIPFPVMRHIETLKPFSRAKQRAIRQLHYDASAKIFLQFRRRFWEEKDGIFGGGTVTDLAVRNVFYPEHGRESGRGVLLASYTWAEDAQRWGSLLPQDRIQQALENIAQIHPHAEADFEAGASQMWHDDQYAGGAFALFDPGQQTLLHEHIISPEGRFHFAGEHASLFHAWIQGAIESGLRAAQEVHQAA